VRLGKVRLWFCCADGIVSSVCNGKGIGISACHGKGIGMSFCNVEAIIGSSLELQWYIQRVCDPIRVGKSWER
jgi:hypothetical protein